MITHVKASSSTRYKEKLKKISPLGIQIIDKSHSYDGELKASQETLGEWFGGYSREHVNRTISALIKEGFLHVQHRFNNSNITSLGSFFLKPDVQHLLPLFFKTFKPILFSVSMLSSAAPDHKCHTTFRNPEASGSYSLSILASSLIGYSKGQGESVVVPEAGLIKKVCLSLMRRGASVENDDALNLLAFPVSAHERAIEEVKKQKNINSPKAYYFSLVRKFTVEDGYQPNWTKVQQLRDSGFRILQPEEEKKQVTQSPTRSSFGNSAKYPQKQEGVSRSYTEQVQQERKKMAEESKKWENSGMTLAEKIMYWNNVLVETQRKADEGDQIAKNGIPFAKMILQGFMDAYVVNPDNEKAMATARSFTAPVSSTSEFKTPASCLSSLIPSKPVVNKSEPVALNSDMWDDWKEYDPMLEEEQ